MLVVFVAAVGYHRARGRWVPRAMQIGDVVEIRYPDGVTEPGVLAAFDAHTVTVRRAGAEDGAFIVPLRRLYPEAPGRWRLDL